MSAEVTVSEVIKCLKDGNNWGLYKKGSKWVVRYPDGEESFGTVELALSYLAEWVILWRPKK